MTRASTLVREGLSRDAVPLLDDVVAADPDCSVALKERGYARLFSGDHPGAIADFTEMVRKWPANPDGLTCRAQTRKSKGDLQGAIDDYSAAIAVDPKHPFAYLQRGRLKVRMGDLSGAISDFSADMEFSTAGRLSGLLNRGETKHLLSDVSGAIADLTEAIGLEGERPIYAPLSRGPAKLTAQDYEGAIADFTVAIESFPGLANAYRHRAEARAFAGDGQGMDDDLAHYNQLGGRDLPAYCPLKDCRFGIAHR